MTVLCADVRLISPRRTTRVTESADVSPAWLHIGVSLYGEWPLVVLFCTKWALSQRRPDEDLSYYRQLAPDVDTAAVIDSPIVSPTRHTDNLLSADNISVRSSFGFTRYWLYLISALVAAISSLKPLDAYWGLTSSEVMVCITSNQG